MKLYELAEAFESMRELELEDEQLQTMLQSFDMTLTETVEDLAKFIQMLESDVEAYDKQIKLFSDKKKAVSKKVEGIKGYIKNSLIKMGKDKIKGTLFSVSLQKSYAVIIDDDEAIPQKYKEYERICKIDKNELKKAMKTELITGAHIQENLNLQIK